MTSNFHFVGVDPALRKIGICILLGQSPVVLHCIKTPAKLAGPERLAWLRDKLRYYLENWAPFEVAAIESQSLGSLGDLDQLGQINGVLQVALADLGAKKLVRVAPTQLKKFITGQGQASKSQMRAATKENYGYDIDQDDICDAHGLAQIARAIISPATKPRRHELEVIHKLTNKTKRKRPIRKKTCQDKNI